MKLPKTFRKENLDEKTAKLAEQANITKKAEAIYPQELKDFIKKYCKEDKKSDTEILHAAVDNLLAQTDYLPKGEDETFEHWIRDDPKNIEGKYVLTRNNLDRNRGRYIFAKVNNKNLETYISTVEEKLNNETEFWDMITDTKFAKTRKTAGYITGAAFGIGGLLFGLSINAEWASTYFLLPAILTMAGNAIAQFTYTLYKDKTKRSPTLYNYKKSLDEIAELYDDFEHNEKEALEAAFS